jgi:hypothetical protein
MTTQNALPDTIEMARTLAALPEDTDSRDWPFAREILYNRMDYQQWMGICKLAETLTASEVLKTWFLLEYVNGLRRQHRFDAAYATTQLDEAKRRIDALIHPRKTRLTELWAYHGAMVYDRVGAFWKSADCHAVAAQMAIASGNTKTVAIECYLQHKAWMDEETIQSCQFPKAPTKMSQAKIFRELTKCADLLQPCLSDTDPNDLRWRATIAGQLLLYAYIVGEPRRPEMVQHALDYIAALPADIQPALAEMATFLRGLKYIAGGAWSDACHEATDWVFPTDGETDWVNYTVLLKGKALTEIGRIDDARRTYNALIDSVFTCQRGYVAAAIALRLLAQPPFEKA